jgi:flagellar biosynthesis protein FliR
MMIAATERVCQAPGFSRSLGPFMPRKGQRRMTVAILPELSVMFMLVFARVGTMVMLMPGIGERFVSARIRIAIAFFLTLLMLPMARSVMGAPQTGAALITLLLGEILIGLVLAGAIRIVIACLQTAGVIIANQLGLGFAMAVDPSVGNQNPTIGNFLVLLGMTLVMVADLHHLAIAAIHESYRTLPPGGLPAAGDVLSLALKAMAKSFSLAVQLSAPFIVFGLLFNLGLGVLARMMPALQVFFLAVPASIMIGMLILIAVLSVMMSVYLQDLGDFIRLLMGT